MNEFWSQWIIIFIIITLVGYYVLGWWFGAINNNEHWDDAHHVSYQRWGEIRASNHPIPNYWSFIFYLSAVGVGLYLILYPGFGNLPGKLNWTAIHQYETEHAQYTALYIAKFNQYLNRTIPELAADPGARKIGKRLFSAYCSNCHQNPGGKLQAPNLTDQDWLWGGAPEQIKETITKGRTGIMPAWELILGERGLSEVTNYVMTLAGRNPIDPALVTAGQEKFARYCYFCHGRDGRGDQRIGAPNLTDNIWLHIPDAASDNWLAAGISRAVAQGFQNSMPAHWKMLDPARIHLLSAYVYSLSH